MIYRQGCRELKAMSVTTPNNEGPWVRTRPQPAIRKQIPKSSLPCASEQDSEPYYRKFQAGHLDPNLVVAIIHHETTVKSQKPPKSQKGLQAALVTTGIMFQIVTVVRGGL